MDTMTKSDRVSQKSNWSIFLDLSNVLFYLLIFKVWFNFMCDGTSFLTKKKKKKSPFVIIKVATAVVE